MKQFRRGMTIFELVVIIAIVGILLSAATVAYLNVRQQNRDTVRVSDVSQIRIALSAYRRDLGNYPVAITAGQEFLGSTTAYMDQVPTNPLPVDGSCVGLTEYTYSGSPDQRDYCLYFCLGDQTGDLAAGTHAARPTGIVGGNECPF